MNMFVEWCPPERRLLGYLFHGCFCFCSISKPGARKETLRLRGRHASKLAGLRISSHSYDKLATFKTCRLERADITQA